VFLVLMELISQSAFSNLLPNPGFLFQLFRAPDAVFLISRIDLRLGGAPPSVSSLGEKAFLQPLVAAPSVNPDPLTFLARTQLHFVTRFDASWYGGADTRYLAHGHAGSQAQAGQSVLHHVRSQEVATKKCPVQ
jgi:hypothetical protein